MFVDFISIKCIIKYMKLCIIKRMIKRIIKNVGKRISRGPLREGVVFL